MSSLSAAGEVTLVLIGFRKPPPQFALSSAQLPAIASEDVEENLRCVNRQSRPFLASATRCHSFKHRRRPRYSLVAVRWCAAAKSRKSTPRAKDVIASKSKQSYTERLNIHSQDLKYGITQ